MLSFPIIFSRTVLDEEKIMKGTVLAGPEIGGGNFLSDTVPEEKVAELRQLPNTHYK